MRIGIKWHKWIIFPKWDKMGYNFRNEDIPKKRIKWDIYNFKNEDISKMRMVFWCWIKFSFLFWCWIKFSFY